MAATTCFSTYKDTKKSNVNKNAPSYLSSLTSYLASLHKIYWIKKYEEVTIWRPYSIPRSATNCSMRSALPLAFYGAKLLNLFQSGVYFPEKNAAALRGAQRLRYVESMGTGCLM